MKRALLKSPLSLHLVGALILLIFSLTGAKSPVPGEILLQEGVYYRTEGRQFQQIGELQRAAAAFRHAVQIKPDYAEAYNDLGVVLESLGDLEQAEEAYKTALKFKPDFRAAHSNLALLYEESDRVKEAAVHWVARLRFGPLGDPWVIAAREKLAKYNLPVPETETDKKKAEKARRKEAARQAELERELDQAKHLKEARIRAVKETVGGKQAARQLRGFEEARRKEAEAKGRAQKAEAQRQMEAAKRIEAESRAEKIKEKAATDRKLQEFEKARRQAEEAKRRAADAVIKPAAKAKVKPEPSRAPVDAQALAREIARERSQVRGRALDDLYRRATVAMREDLYQDAIEIYKQVLILEPDNRNAKQGLERAQKALAKQLI